MGLWRDKGSGKWRYSFENQKKSYAGAGFATKAEARAAREERRKEVKAQAQQKSKTDTAFSSVANLYLDWSEKRHVRKTYEYKRTVFREFIKAMGDMDLMAISPAVLHAYLVKRPSNHNYNVHRKELCALFSFAIRQLRLIDRSPCWTLEKMPEETARKEIPTQEEFLRIMVAAGPDERPLLVILSQSLARIDEILRLTWQDVNFEKRLVTLWTRKRKGGNLEPRTIGMSENLYRMLWAMWNRRDQQQWVFFNAKEGTRYNRRPKLMRSLCKRAGVKHYGFHSIRHFCATYLHDVKKVPTGVIGTILGHKSKRTTEIYLHSVDEASRAAVAHLDDLFTVAADGCGFEEIRWK
jgi:integrase